MKFVKTDYLRRRKMKNAAAPKPAKATADGSGVPNPKLVRAGFKLGGVLTAPPMFWSTNGADLPAEMKPFCQPTDA
jgi:hypothetical protein